MNELYLNLFKAGSVIVFLLLIDFIAEFLIIRNIKDQKTSIKSRVLLRYVLSFCFLFFMAKIWVEGFGYLLTFVGVVAAALTITQKEYLMNLFGWLIIMWRDLFEEGDYIEVGKYRGYVINIAPLYFSLEEASEYAWGDKTGRVVKIPNSLIAAHPIVNFTVENGFTEGRIAYTFTMTSKLEKIKEIIPILDKEIKKLLNTLNKQWTQTQHTEFADLKGQGSAPQFLLRVSQSSPSGISLKIRYLSLKSEQKVIEDKAFDIVMNAVTVNEDLELAQVRV